MRLFFLFILIICFQNVFAGINNWQESNPSLAPSHLNIYQGPAYADAAFKQAGQNLVLNLSDFPGGLIQNIRFRLNGSGSWTQLSAGYPYVNLGNLTSTVGVHVLNLQIIPYTGQTFYTNHYLFVVPDAHKRYEDSAGNVIVKWGESGSHRKPVLLAEGFDPINTNSPNYYYAAGKDIIEPLLQLNHDFYVIDFADGGADLNQNKDVVKSAIKLLNDLSSNDLIVMGMSMGGVLARHALVSLENEFYTHNVSHFISLDAPQNGAVMDMELLNWIEDNNGNNPALNSTAAKQLLQETPFDSSNMHSQYYNALRNLNNNNGYPESTINFGVAFSSSDLPNNLNEKWLTIDKTGSNEHFYIESHKNVYQPGSKLPIGSTQQAGWSPVLLWGFIPINAGYNFIRLEHPTFIPFESALDVNNGLSSFDLTIHPSNGRFFHDEIPQPLIQEIINIIDFPVIDNYIFSGSTTTQESSIYTGNTTINSNVTVTVAGSNTIYLNGTLSGTGTNNSVLVVEGNVIITNEANISGVQIIVENGAHIEIRRGATLNNSEITVNNGGHLLANGATSNKITFNGKGLVFQSGSSGTINYATIKNATTGIWATGSSTSINIYDNVISDNGTGVHLTSTGTNVHITDNVIEDNTIGMWLYQSNAVVSGNIIESNTYGMNADYVSSTAEHDGNKVRYNTARGMFLNSSNLWVTTSVFAGNGGNQVLINDGWPSFAESPGFEGYNVIAYGAGPMLKAQNGAYVFMGYSADGGINSFYDTDMPHIRAENNSGVWADRNYWEGGPGNSMDGTSWVTSNNTLSSDPNPPYYQKMIAGNNTTNRYDESENHTRVPEELLTAMRVSMDGEMEQGLSDLKSYIENDRQSSFAPLALIGYNALVHRQMQGLASEGPRQTLQDELTAYLQSQSTTGQSDPLWPYAVRLLANNAMLESDYEIGRDHLLSLVEFSSYDSVHNLLAHYNLFTYYLEVEQNYEMATSYLSQLLRNHPDDELTQTAQVLAGIYLNSVPDPITEQHGEEKQIADIVQVGAYPNPFNPNAVIRYSIPEDGQVRLAVFDVLGRQVSELVNGSVRAGVHEVAFNGANLASGIYVYRLQVSGQIITGKMMLLK